MGRRPQLKQFDLYHIKVGKSWANNRNRPYEVIARILDINTHSILLNQNEIVSTRVRVLASTSKTTAEALHEHIFYVGKGDGLTFKTFSIEDAPLYIEWGADYIFNILKGIPNEYDGETFTRGNSQTTVPGSR